MTDNSGEEIEEQHPEDDFDRRAADDLEDFVAFEWTTRGSSDLTHDGQSRGCGCFVLVIAIILAVLILIGKSS